MKWLHESYGRVTSLGNLSRAKIKNKISAAREVTKIPQSNVTTITLKIFNFETHSGIQLTLLIHYIFARCSRSVQIARITLTGMPRSPTKQQQIIKQNDVNSLWNRKNRARVKGPQDIRIATRILDEVGNDQTIGVSATSK